jgi:predicted helicase
LDAHALGKEKESVTKLEGKVLDQLHKEISRQAGGIETAEGKQRFLIKIYDKFFRIALQKTAERLGIVYTPIEIVDFILQSVEAVLEDEFGQRLTDEQVHILDPFTGTGTFLVRLMLSGLIRPEDVVRKYRHELHANEIVLLAYYLAAINIEQTFHAVSGQDYEPFPGIVLTDTFQQGESRKDFMGHEMFPENNARLARQNKTEIRVIVGNPPYSVGQDNANDNNQNIKYPVLDDRIRDTYAAHSTAVNKNSLYDSYIRAFRWASDRIGQRGIIGFVTNGRWIDGNTMDGFRQMLSREFSTIYVLNLRGFIRGRSGDAARREGDNVFNIMTGVAITILVKNFGADREPCQLHYHDIGNYLSRNEKLAKLAHSVNIRGLEWTTIRPNAQQDWLNQRSGDFQSLVALGSRDTQEHSIFSFYSNGVQTNRDAWVYNFDSEALRTHMQATIAFYNDQVAEHRGSLSSVGGDDAAKLAATLVDTNPRAIKWTSSLIADLCRAREGEFRPEQVGISLYRPFCKQWLYYDRQFNHRYKEAFYPSNHYTNLAIAVPSTGSRQDFSVLIVNVLPDLHLAPDAVQCFPWSVYEKKSGSVTPDFFDETHREEFTRHDGITDWALQQCRVRYGPSVNKEDIFYYVYGLLHAPDYRSRFATDLKKMLPRIPFVERQEDFWAFSHAGRELAHWHLDYETVEPWELTEQTTREEEVAAATYRVQKMRWGKAADGAVDKTVIHYNADITLEGIPLEAYDYVVNGKSAVEWVMERYQVKTDKDSGIVNDPNAWSDDPRYILDLVKRVVRVSMETLRIVGELPRLLFAAEESAQ